MSATPEDWHLTVSRFLLPGFKLAGSISKASSQLAAACNFPYSMLGFRQGAGDVTHIFLRLVGVSKKPLFLGTVACIFSMFLLFKHQYRSLLSRSTCVCVPHTHLFLASTDGSSAKYGICMHNCQDSTESYSA